MTKEQILKHPKFPDLFLSLMGDLMPFAGLCVFNEDVRASILARLIDAGP